MTAATVIAHERRAARRRRARWSPPPSATTPHPDRDARPDARSATSTDLHRDRQGRQPPASRISRATRSRPTTLDASRRAPPRATGCPCSIWTELRRARRPTDGGPQRGRARLTFRSDVAGFITGTALLQGRDQHRHARREAVDEHRAAAGHGDVHRRDRVRLAGGRASHAGRDHRQHDLRHLVSRPQRPLLGERDQYFADRRRRQPAAARAARRRRRRQRRLQIRHERDVPERHVPVGGLLRRRRVQHRHRPGHHAADGHRPGSRRTTRPASPPATNVLVTFSEAHDRGDHHDGHRPAARRRTTRSCPPR